jgi:hypothetical protein
VCAVKTNDGHQVGFTFTVGGGVGVSLTAISPSDIRRMITDELEHALLHAEVSGGFTYQTSNANCLNQLGSWFNYHTSAFTVGIPYVLSVTGSKTDFNGPNHIHGSDYSVGLAKAGGLPFGAGANTGVTWTYVVRLHGAAAHVASAAIGGLDFATAGPRWLLRHL